MGDAFALAEKLGTVGFPTLLVIILVGNYFEVWCWGRELRKSEARALYWQTTAERLAGMAEMSLGIQKSTRQP